jgi:catechol 2,3-dioxygenase
MTTMPLDVESLLSLTSDEQINPKVYPATDIGHVHLQVSDLKAAENFYSGELGFEVTQRSYPGALFFAAGGYHHHIGTNIWAGRGAPRPPENSSGLISFSIIIPNHQTESKTVFDPDGIQIELTSIQTLETGAGEPISFLKK